LTHTIFPVLAKPHTPIVYDEGGVGLILGWNKHGRWINFCESVGKSKLKSSVKNIFCKALSTVSGGVLPTVWNWPKQMRIYYNSAFSLMRHRQAGVPVNDAQVIYSGIDLSQFNYRNRNKLDATIQILLPGRIHPEKGLDDALESVVVLNQKMRDHEFYLRFIGPIQDHDYQALLKKRIDQNSLTQYIHFFDLLPHGEMENVFHSADICLLLTRIPESFSRVPLEAMACGAILITTSTGGGAEILRDGRNGFIVPMNSPHIIAEIIEKLIASPDLVQSIVTTARKDVEEHFTLERSVDQIEQVLMNAAQAFA
jgi:glycosyltransferase involved in cell wall biosynthesis